MHRARPFVHTSRKSLDKYTAPLLEKVRTIDQALNVDAFARGRLGPASARHAPFSVAKRAHDTRAARYEFAHAQPPGMHAALRAPSTNPHSPDTLIIDHTALSKTGTHG